MIRYARDARATGRAFASDKRISLRRGCFLLGLDDSGRQVAAAQVEDVSSGDGGDQAYLEVVEGVKKYLRQEYRTTRKLCSPNCH